MTLTKSNLFDSIYNQCGQSKGTSAALVESLLEIMKKTFESGEDVLISGFGKFSVKEKRERRGVRNPNTGEGLMLGARKVVTFRSSSVLRDKIK